MKDSDIPKKEFNVKDFVDTSPRQKIFDEEYRNDIAVVRLVGLIIVVALAVIVVCM